MKQLIQRAIAPLGYTFRKISSLAPYMPHKRKFDYPGASFQMWIANADSDVWYPTELCQNSGEYYALQNLVKPGDRVLEIGAHHGFTGLYLSRFIGDNGHIVSVEANPSNALIDDAQTTLNKFQNLRFVHFAASNKPGKVRISTNHNASVCNNGNSSEVEAITGDLLDSKYGPFNVLKVDVEGYELEVLQGCSQLLNRSPKLAIELHLDDLSKFGHRVEDVWDLINADKYKGEMIVRPARPNNRIPFSISAVKNLKHDANSPYLIVNIFLSR